MSASDRTPADRRRFAERMRDVRPWNLESNRTNPSFDRAFADHTQQMIEAVTKRDER